MKLPYLDLDQLSVKLQETADVMSAKLDAVNAHTSAALEGMKTKLEIIEQCLQGIAVIEVLRGDGTTQSTGWLQN